LWKIVFVESSWQEAISELHAEELRILTAYLNRMNKIVIEQTIVYSPEFIFLGLLFLLPLALLIVAAQVLV